jgi:hypothetical protein
VVYQKVRKAHRVDYGTGFQWHSVSTQNGPRIVRPDTVLALQNSMRGIGTLRMDPFAGGSSEASGLSQLVLGIPIPILCLMPPIASGIYAVS